MKSNVYLLMAALLVAVSSSMSAQAQESETAAADDSSSTQGVQEATHGHRRDFDSELEPHAPNQVDLRSRDSRLEPLAPFACQEARAWGTSCRWARTVTLNGTGTDLCLKCATCAACSRAVLRWTAFCGLWCRSRNPRVPADSSLPERWPSG